MIAKITSAKIVHYIDNGQTKAYVGWIDHSGRAGTTEGEPHGAHMTALLKRAEREGVAVTRETSGWLPFLPTC